MISVRLDSNYALLKPVFMPPPAPGDLTIIERVQDPAAELGWIFSDHPQDDYMALDFETRGDYCATRDEPAGYPVSIGLADSRGAVYIDFRDSHPETYWYIISELQSRNIRLVAHNMMFDAGFTARDFPETLLNWHACTYATYRLAATEGFPGQGWGLKQAQLDMLGWTETNEHDLDRWLIDNGHIGSISKLAKQGYEFYPEWPTIKGPQPRYVSPDKSKMYLAPAHILGHYCALDAWSTYALFKYVLEPAIQAHPALAEYLLDYPRYIQIHIAQRLSGIRIDLNRLATYKQLLETSLAEQEHRIITHEEILGYVQRFNRQILDKYALDEPVRFKIQPKVGAEPRRYTKSGAESKNWIRWQARRTLIEITPPEETINYQKWSQRMELAAITQHFSVNSPDHLRGLIYEHLVEGYCTQDTDWGTLVKVRYQGRDLEFDATDSGGLPTDDVVLKQLGAVGKLLLNYRETSKLIQFCESLDACSERDHEATDFGCYRPNFRVPGTYTGRLAGGGGVAQAKLNLQAVPKDVGFLSCFVPRPGCIWIDCDVSALEMVVLTELSQDPALWQVYGPGAPPNDIYLYLGSQLPIIGPKIRAAGYDPANPTTEGVARAKKECKRERAVAKTIQLAAGYGAGAGKIWKTLTQSGLDIQFEEVRKLVQAYRDLYAGVYKWESSLVQEFEDRGYVLNGLGRPLGIYHKKMKDLVNRVCQSTGHDIQYLSVLIADELLAAAGEVRWIIADWHDATTVEARIEDGSQVLHILQTQVFDRLNRQLGGQLPLRGDGGLVRNLAEAKCDPADIQEFCEMYPELDWRLK